MKIKVVSDAVAERLAACGDSVTERVVGFLAEQEICDRVNDVVAATTKMTEMAAEQKRLDKFDVETFSAEGEVETQAYSKKRSEDRARNAASITRLEKAVSDAFDNNKWAELRKIVRK